jgi:Spy/CpxP family protein refolding chaperone
LTDRLQLTKAKEAQLNEILEASRREIDASRTEWESKLQSIRTKTNERIATILNDEQKKKFQQLLSEAGTYRESGRQGHGHGGH